MIKYKLEQLLHKLKCFLLHRQHYQQMINPDFPDYKPFQGVMCMLCGIKWK